MKKKPIEHSADFLEGVLIGKYDAEHGLFSSEALMSDNTEYALGYNHGYISLRKSGKKSLSYKIFSPVKEIRI